MKLAPVHDLLRRIGGIDPQTLSRVGLRSAVGRRMATHGCEDVEAYADRLAADAGEFDALVQAVLIHETSFFRYPASFDVLVGDAVRRLRERAETVYRVHCVASSTGEEPASVVMALRGAGLAPQRFHVDATDISERAVRYAREGRYRRRGVERVPAEVRARWFLPDGEGYRLHGEIRASIRHRVASALAPDFGVGSVRYDVVLCRNLLIYLVPEARTRLLAALRGMLRPGGLLLVGHAEVSAARAAGLELVPPPEAFACRRAPVAASPSVPAPRRSRAAPPVAPARPPIRPAPPVPSGAAVLEAATGLADAGKLAEARRALLDGIASGPATADHYHLLALVESARGAEDASEEALRRALYLEPHHHPSLMQLALLVESRGERGRAARLRAKAARARGEADGR